MNDLEVTHVQGIAMPVLVDVEQVHRNKDICPNGVFELRDDPAYTGGDEDGEGNGGGLLLSLLVLIAFHSTMRS